MCSPEKDSVSVTGLHCVGLCGVRMLWSFGAAAAAPAADSMSTGWYGECRHAISYSHMVDIILPVGATGEFDCSATSCMVMT